MSREILFKAKYVDTGEWVEGSLVYYKAGKKHFIITDNDFQWGMYGSYSYDGDFTEIDETTICQYTGLTDKNGKKIWENDLIEVKKGKSHFISQIEWDDWCKGFMFQDTKTTACGMDALSGSGCYHFDYEVIGNIFDNPELVEGGAT